MAVFLGLLGGGIEIRSSLGQGSTFTLAIPLRIDGERGAMPQVSSEAATPMALDRVLIGLDFFDASINRVAAWIIGTRNAEKALLWALLQPNQQLKALQDAGNFTEKFMLMEEAKTLPFSDIWAEYCRREGVPADASWFEEIKKYEQDIQSKR